MASAMISAPDVRLTPSSIWSKESRTDNTATILSQVEASISVEQAPAGADPVLSDVDKLVAAFVRVRGLNRLEGGIISRCWLAHDMKMSPDKLDSLLSLLRWRGLVRLPNPDIVIVGDADAMRDIALSCPPLPSVVVPLHRKKAA